MSDHRDPHWRSNHETPQAPTPAPQGPITSSLEEATDSRSRPKLILVVEGAHDIRFLKTVSAMRHADDPSLPALAKLEQRGNLIIVPFGGGNASQWTSRFAGLDCPEIHIYDREIPPLTEQRRRAVEAVNSRPGCLAFLTSKRATENYLHSAAIHAVRGIQVRFCDNDDVPALVAERVCTMKGGPRAWERVSRYDRKRMRDHAKRWLNTQAAERMTSELLAERDPAGEIDGWLRAIAERVG